ncbi:hypothetical protein VULLAG_LOCUS8716 [Vulpes lagopus]
MPYCGSPEHECPDAGASLHQEEDGVPRVEVTTRAQWAHSGQPAAPKQAAPQRHAYLPNLHGCLCSTLKLPDGRSWKRDSGPEKGT